MEISNAVVNDKFVKVSYDLPICGHCGSINAFIYENGDADLGDMVCTHCAMSVAQSDLQYTKSDKQIPIHDHYVQNFRYSYAREAHIHERVRQHLCQEPEIARDHIVVLRDYYENKYLPKFCFLKQITEDQKRNAIISRGKSLSKDDIRYILRSIDKENKKDGATDAYPFCTKYLEKWKKIKKILTNESLPQYTSQELNTIVDLFLKFSATWNEMQPPQMKHKKEESWLFTERKHFPNFNFIWRKCCEIKKIPFDPLEWPIPKSSKCLNRLQEYYKTMCLIMGIEIEQVNNPQKCIDEIYQKKSKSSTTIKPTINSNIQQQLKPQKKIYKQTSIKWH